MDVKNQTIPSEFIILGFSNIMEFQEIFFGILLLIYLTTLAGNIGIIVVTRLDVCLHKPMYFFLMNLSFLDICYTSTTVPKMLENLSMEKKTISYVGCITQLYFFVSFVGTECVLLAVMAYDRYVAICNPLRYTIIMSKMVCGNLAASCWIAGMANSAIHTYFTFRLPFCGANELNYFFCDIPPLLSLACADTSINEATLLTIGVFIGWTPFLCIIMSYIYIISTILKIRSTKGRHKAFSTCGSHLTMVLLYYGSAIFTYVRPISSYSLNKDRLVSMLYSFVTPMLNPIIYTLKNKEVKSALKKVLKTRRALKNEKGSTNSKCDPRNEEQMGVHQNKLY
ncbi:olfactory receptor 5V1-like [Microcaecilia unicolor]|uniref:Olfactory receptor n=1 Tax=Microcaecilia unicolor TaxID=1415580 RepID=A0A6P7WVY8_9AMPH|nr:olfactory receptor 5V1-like [Microcaecilia unicolor]